MWSSSQQHRGFRLAQISDCHLPRNPQMPYRGLNADQGLAGVVAAVARWRPDGIMLTGDLSEDASPESYQRLAAMIGELGVPVCALPGNHDDPVIMQHDFPEGPYAGPHLRQVGEWQLALLNSARPGRIDGSLDESELQALTHSLAHKRVRDRPVLLALHHQPVPIGAPWIDRYMLQQPQVLLQWIGRCPAIKAVTWGHVHQVFETQRDGIRFLSAPSSAANSLAKTPRFALDPAGPACRWFELFADGSLQSGILHAGETAG